MTTYNSDDPSQLTVLVLRETRPPQRAQNLVWQYEHRLPQPSANLVLWQIPQVGASSRCTAEPAEAVACRITVSL